MTSDRGDYGAKSPARRLAVGNPKEFASMSAETYRHNAAECLEMSLAVADPEVRGLLKRMAIAWTNLAEQAEKRVATVHRPTTATVAAEGNRF